MIFSCTLHQTACICQIGTLRTTTFFKLSIRQQGTSSELVHQKTKENQMNEHPKNHCGSMASRRASPFLFYLKQESEEIKLHSESAMTWTAHTAHTGIHGKGAGGDSCLYSWTLRAAASSFVTIQVRIFFELLPFVSSEFLQLSDSKFCNLSPHTSISC